MKKNRRPVVEGGFAEINLTPMIDVVFQLIIFFMCAMKFKTLDYKIELNIPKKYGLKPDSVLHTEKVKVRVTMRQAIGEGVPRILIFGKEVMPEVGHGIAPLPRLGRNADRAARRAANARHGAFWEKNVAPKLLAVEERLRIYAARNDTLEYVIDAAPTVRHEFVVGVLDSFLAAGIENVQFRGAPGPRSGQ